MKRRCASRSDACCALPTTRSAHSPAVTNFSRRSRPSQPACVLLDVHMPGLTGFDVIKRMRAAHIDIPVIFITASDARDIDQTASQSGARLLRKPFSNDVLLAAVEARCRASVDRAKKDPDHEQIYREGQGRVLADSSADRVLLRRAAHRRADSIVDEQEATAFRFRRRFRSAWRPSSSARPYCSPTCSR